LIFDLQALMDSAHVHAAIRMNRDGLAEAKQLYVHLDLSGSKEPPRGPLRTERHFLM
jgi:hypothetical protein